MFDCGKCGLCCIGLNKHEAMDSFHDGDGICRHLDQETMLCTIYEERPLVCRIDDYYDKYLAGKMDKDEFMRLNYEACLLKKKEYEECGGDIHKMISVIPEYEAEKQEIVWNSLQEMMNDVNKENEEGQP